MDNSIQQLKPVPKKERVIVKVDETLEGLKESEAGELLAADHRGQA